MDEMSGCDYNNISVPIYILGLRETVRSVQSTFPKTQYHNQSKALTWTYVPRRSGNRTKWSPAQSEIVSDQQNWTTTKQESNLFNHKYDYWAGLIEQHKVLLPILNITIPKFENKRSKGEHQVSEGNLIIFEIQKRGNPFKCKCPTTGCANDTYCPDVTPGMMYELHVK